MDSSRRRASDQERFSIAASFDDGEGRMHRALRKAEGLQMVGRDRGLLMVGEHVAEVRLQPNEQIQVSLAVPTAASRVQAAEQNHRLPGNLRYALTGRGTAVLADTQLDGELHLSESFQQIRVGLLQSQDADALARQVANPPLPSECVHEVLAKLGWNDDGVVEQEEGWELRPRVRGDAAPVQVRIEQSELRLFRIVLRQVTCGGETGAEPVADLALRFNARLRHARLAVHEGRLVAETRLHRGLVRASWVSMAAYAVAVAARHVETAFRILVGQPAVAENYAAMFCSTGEQATSDDVGV